MSAAIPVDAYVAACQIGIALSSLVAGAYGQAQLSPLLEPALGSLGGRLTAVLVVLVAITAVQVVLGELLPKTGALRYPEKLVMATLPPMQISQWVFRPAVALFNGSAFKLMKLWDLQIDHTHAHSPEELAGLYRASAACDLIGPFPDLIGPSTTTRGCDRTSPTSTDLPCRVRSPGVVRPTNDCRL